MGIRFTARQERAMTADRLLSVVAGAGTGKTAVLTERYVRILEHHLEPDNGQVVARPDQIVAVTFTKKAAEQMRDRIRRKITKRIQAARQRHAEASRAGDTAGQDAAKSALRHWTRMRRLLAEAPITTIDGLANLIVREFGIEVGVDPDSTILDTVDEELLRDQTARDVLRSPPDDARDALGALYRMHDGRSVLETLKGLLGNRTHADQWAAHMKTHEPDAIFHDLAPALVPFDDAQADDILERLDHTLAPLAALPHDPASDDKRHTSIQVARTYQGAPRDDLLEKATAIWRVLEHFTSRSGTPSLYKGPSSVLGAKSLWTDMDGDAFTKPLLAELNDVFEPLIDTFHGVPDEHDRQLLHIMRGLASAYETARDQMQHEKQRRGAFDFHDVAVHALRILQRDSLADQLRKRWRHIMVDEFQDTNGLQWAILCRLGAEPPTTAPLADDEDDDEAFQTAAAHFGIEPDHAVGALATLAELDIDTVGTPDTAPDVSQLSDIADTLSVTDDTVPLGRDRLFIVGDAKQSIYAFRGAEVDVYQHSRQEIRNANLHHGRDNDPLPVRHAPSPDDEHVTETPTERHGEVNLDRNFRSLPNVVASLNHVFGAVLAAEGPTRRSDEAEPGPLVAHRPPLDDADGPRRDDGRGHVALIAAPDKVANAVDAGLIPDTLQERIDLGTYTSHQLAQHIIRFVEADDTIVYDERAEAQRRARYGDVAILIPARTRLGTLTDALRRHDIPYIVHGGRGFWTRQEVWDLINALAHIADPRRDIELVGMLRSPLFGWTDDAIVRLIHHDNRRPLRALEAAADDPTLLGPTRDQCAVDAATTWQRISAWHDAAAALPAAQLLVRVLNDSAYLAAFAEHPDARRILANVHKLTDIVRDLERHRALPLAALVRRIERLIDEEHDEGEADPEVDDEQNAVHIMTIHAAKGLEFPIVYATELGARSGGGPGASLARGTLHGHLMITGKVLGADGERHEPLLHRLVKDEQKRRERAESKRLLYVALTRARDHLFLHGTTKRITDPSADPPRTIPEATTWMEWIEHSLGIDADTYTDVRQDGHASIHAPDATVQVTAPTPTFDAPPQAHIERSTHTEPPRLDDITLPVTTAPIHLAPSDLETLATCTARFRHTVIEGLPDRALRGVQARTLQRGKVFGTLVHRAIAEGQTNGIQDPALHERITGLAERLDDTPIALLNLVDPHVARAHQTLGDTDDTLRELSIDVQVDTHTRVRGTLDMVRFDPTPHVIDHKTDTVQGAGVDALRTHAAAHGYDRQVALYARALGPDTTTSLGYTGAGQLVTVDAEAHIDDLVERIMRDRNARHQPGADGALDTIWPRDARDNATCAGCAYHTALGGPCIGRSAGE